MPVRSKYTIEVCVSQLDHAAKARSFGANRVELCAALPEGGTTPPVSLMEKACDLNIPVHVMIRPRAGDFLYSAEEFEMMKTDIRFAKRAGATGVVIGILNTDGSIDTHRCRMLAEYAAPMHVTFHRAFDLASDPFRALEEVISIGAQTLLTSGQRQTAEDGLEMIRELVKRAGNRIQVMAGSGVNASNVLLLREAGVTAYHFTSHRIVPSPMQFHNEGIASLGRKDVAGTYDRIEFDGDKITAVVNALNTVA
jgi:copper homeostasis protein